MVQNKAAYLKKADTPLEVEDAPLPTAGPGELVVKNAAIAINPLDWHMQDAGVFVQQWPAIFGCEVAGEVYEVGPEVTRFKKGDRVIAHTINLSLAVPKTLASNCTPPSQPPRPPSSPRGSPTPMVS